MCPDRLHSIIRPSRSPIAVRRTSSARWRQVPPRQEERHVSAVGGGQRHAAYIRTSQIVGRHLINDRTAAGPLAGGLRASMPHLPELALSKFRLVADIIISLELHMASSIRVFARPKPVCRARPNPHPPHHDPPCPLHPQRAMAVLAKAQCRNDWQSGSRCTKRELMLAS